MKKTLILALSLLFLNSCAHYTFKKDIRIDKERAVTLKRLIIDAGTFKNDGINYMYRYGYYIYALYQHDILTKDDAQAYCNQLGELYILSFDGSVKGFFSEPVHGSRFMSRDDYLGVLLGLFFANKVNSCAKPHLDYMYNAMMDNSTFTEAVPRGFDTNFRDYVVSVYQKYILNGLKLHEENVWNYYHRNAFIRAVGEDINSMWFWDMVGYVGSAEPICSKPPTDTSDKLLWATMAILAREVNPTGWSRDSDEFCHNKVNFNEILLTYYACSTSHPANCISDLKAHPLAYLLEGLL